VSTYDPGMTAKRWVFVVVALVGLAPLIAALVEQQWVSALTRAFPVVLFGGLAVREFRSPAPPKAWTRRQAVAFTLVMIPLTVVLFGTIIWAAVVSDHLGMQLACAGILVVYSGLIGLGVWIQRKEHLLATAAAGATDS
jgi:hypothetical protein